MFIFLNHIYMFDLLYFLYNIYSMIFFISIAR